MVEEGMGFRFVIGSICAGFLFGVFLWTMIYADQENLLTMERYVFQLKWGFCSAAIVGIFVCAIDGATNLQSNGKIDWNKVREERYANEPSFRKKK
ncbi:MAG: hypothetical protein QF684_06410 [Candidatus Thalassarchaeaceae archaeon]|jgi:hypothetical protein|nr:hypothetical protein [Candidatus Thalassarchaeaceae archaeon]